MPKRRKKARAVDATKLPPDSRIAHADAVHLIADRAIDDSERDYPERQRAARDRVAKRIGYAIKIGGLRPPTPVGFLVKELLLWASREWPGRFDDLPKHASGVVVVTSSVAVRAKGIAGPLMPSDIKQCQELIANQAAMIGELKDQKALLIKKLATLEADAGRRRDHRSKSGRRGRPL